MPRQRAAGNNKMAAYGSDNEGTDTIQAGDVTMGRSPRDSHVGPEGRHATDSGPEKKKKKEAWMDGRRRKKEKEEIVHTELCKLPRRSHFYLVYQHRRQLNI
jgi:hypothetical protein